MSPSPNALKDLFPILAEEVRSCLSSHTRAPVEIVSTSSTGGSSPSRNGAQVAGLIRLKGRFQNADFGLELFLTLPADVCSGLSQSLVDGAEDGRLARCGDWAGELLNVAFGAIDVRARGLGITLKSSLPAGVWGKDLEMVIRRLPANSAQADFRLGGSDIRLEVFPTGKIAVSWREEG